VENNSPRKQYRTNARERHKRSLLCPATRIATGRLLGEAKLKVSNFTVPYQVALTFDLSYQAVERVTVIPGRAARREPGIQAFLRYNIWIPGARAPHPDPESRRRVAKESVDSGFAPAARPGMTQ
jgi:hypothetical protein